MSKKMMVLALAVASAALFALPAVASAQSWHLDSTGAPISFEVTGGVGKLTNQSVTVTCSTMGGAGTFSTSTTGTVSLLFTGCNVLGLNCTTPGQSPGVIATTNSFDAIMVNSTASTKDPGVLLTSDSSAAELTPGQKFFAEFSCAGISTKVFGNGVIGTLENVCGETTKTGKLEFSSSSLASQSDKVYTGVTYDLITNASHGTASLDGTATLHFSSSHTINCT